MDAIICPRCGTQNPASAMNCRHCRINLRYALEHPDQIERTELAAAQRAGDTGQQATPQKTVGILARAALGALSLVIGMFGIVPLFAIGEGTRSGILAYAVLSLIFALLAFGLAKIDPGAWWAYALLICAPVALLSFTGPGADYILVAMLMIAITMVGAYFGASSPRTSHKTPD